ncbi:Sec-independent protein translocase subunit TatB [Campylobacter volucris]|uniref:Sec-independent protein translocase subunit TatB n=2 Tax=Campylobacter volucris TaxID=1031542 RepID=A0AAF1D1V5_9BACT|nr:Sec-independent protein translocase protein TatB [Campylobacter volucris]AJC93969.1 twin arginine translocation system, TatB family protein [Campylobacter volucris LMG 24379]KAB0580551.1 Sec-independent protein translocase subunit TatB [Campylobacter volucris]MBF7042914.1 Sec-independent protein translocase subunit TatB [Campylobacter volucris]MBF7046178.1 Sec-independent protein translocase subunit TatB [Campylobacter volucris]MBF7067331.1 Sec-independent protein translocase subunit TatB [
MSFGEIIVVLVIAILVLGPEKLPSTIVEIAKIIKALKSNIDEAKASINKELKIAELKDEAQKYKDEFSQTNENIRKKLSFEEFDQLKEDILNNTKEIKEQKENLEDNIQNLSQIQNNTKENTQKIES